MLGKDNFEGNLVSNILKGDKNQELIELLESVIRDYKAKDKINRIPINIFSNRKLGILEALVKYLKENTELTYHEIALILNRDDRTIWATHNKAKKKDKNSTITITSEYTIDPKIFSDRKQAPLEAIILHLQSRGISLKQISTILNRSYKTIWLTSRKK